MSEPKADNGARGGDASQDASGRPERDKDEFEAHTGYQPSTNQTRDEPLPASHHDDGGQETARRREPVRDNPSPRGQEHEGSRGQDHEGSRGQEHEGSRGQEHEGSHGQDHEEE